MLPIYPVAQAKNLELLLSPLFLISQYKFIHKFYWCLLNESSCLHFYHNHLGACFHYSLSYTAIASFLIYAGDFLINFLHATGLIFWNTIWFYYYHNSLTRYHPSINPGLGKKKKKTSGRGRQTYTQTEIHLNMVLGWVHDLSPTTLASSCHRVLPLHLTLHAFQHQPSFKPFFQPSSL